MNKPSQNLEKHLFEAALAKSTAEERATFLDGVCEDNPALRARLDLLLEGQFQAEGFLSVPSKKIEHESAPPPADAETGSAYVGRYKLLEKIGEGGFGEVWMAEQKEPVKRRVALKIIKLGMDTKQVVARFGAERQALAMMDHPNIAKVLDAGPTDTGRPYFVMELVRGVRITEFCDQNQFPTQERLKLFIQVCRAIQHAHQKGVIHRDIKPSNILVTLQDGLPVPKVIDFGIAKATQVELTDKTVFTQFRQFLGTPAYVSPEQAQMGTLDVDTRSDIYSLGVLLYELLTGLTPFDSQELLKAGLEAMQRVFREQPPLRPSTRLTGMQEDELTATAKRRGADPPRLIHLIRGDLDWIVMKCLEKERSRRYETANGLARDIERYLNNEPVTARPPSRLYEFRKTLRRHWVGFAAGTALVVMLAAGVVVSSLEALRARHSEREQFRLREDDIAQRRRAESGEQRAEKLLYAGKMKLAQAAWEQNRPGRVQQILEETAGYPERGFEWYYWQRQTHRALKTLHGHLDWVWSVAFSPDGRRIVTGCSDGISKVWDADTGKELLSLGDISSAARFLKSNGLRREETLEHPNGVTSVVFSPDGSRIATGNVNRLATVWDASTGRELQTLRGHSDRVNSVAFSTDGRQLVTGSWDHTAKVWDLASGKPLFTFTAHSGQVEFAAFTADGQHIASGSDDKTAMIWEAATGKVLLTLKGHSGAVWWVAVSPDGRRIVTASDDRTAIVWDASTGNELFPLLGHSEWVNTAEFSPDGQRILTSSDDRTARLWDAVTGQALFTLRAHADKVNSAAFSRDGIRIVTGSDDKTAKIWETNSLQDAITFSRRDREIVVARFSPDGRLIATVGTGYLEICDAASTRTLLSLSGQSHCLAFFPDSQRVVTGCRDQIAAKIWDVTNGKCLLTLEGHSGPVIAVAVSADGHRILTGSGDRTARMWDAATGKFLFELEHSNPVCSLAFSPDSQRILTASFDPTPRVWDSANGRILLTLNGHTDGVIGTAFSPDGRYIVTGSDDRTAKIWGATNGDCLRILIGHSLTVYGVGFSPDGRRVVTSSADQTAKLWDFASGEELLTLNGHNDSVYSIAVSPDGGKIVTGSVDRTARLWEAATPQQVTNWHKEERESSERMAALERERTAAGEQEWAMRARDPGAIRQWLVLSPLTFQGKNGADAIAREQVPRESQLRPRAGEQITNGENQLAWRAVQMKDYILDFVEVNALRSARALAYGVCYIGSETDQTGLEMKIGSEHQAMVYLNGEEVYRCVQPRIYVRDEDVVSGVKLKAGLNVLVFKLVNDRGDWRASIRFTDAAGQSVKGIRVALTPP